MEIIAWFGGLDTDAGSFFPAADDERMVEALLEPARSSSPNIQIQPDLRSLAKSYGFVKSDREYNIRLRKVALGLAQRKLKAWATAEQDLLQAVEALDDMNQAVNLMDERLYEWSRLHRDEIVHGKDLATALCEDKVMGELARAVLSLRESRRLQEAEVGSVASGLVPNLSALAGPVLAARLISHAGSLKRLAEMPSSVIQVMGAEKALFKHLRGNAPSPKHGIIYRHPAVFGTPKKLRGRAARAVAAKLAIAARLDYYGSGLSEDLKVSLEKRLSEIRRSKKPPSGR